MGLFELFTHRPSMKEGLAQMQNEKNAVLLDVRTPEEYRAGHLPGAVNLPLDRLNTIDIPAERPIFAYCHSGARSARACSWLERAGYRTVNLGGLMHYQGRLEP